MRWTSMRRQNARFTGADLANALNEQRSSPPVGPQLITAGDLTRHRRVIADPLALG